MNINTPIKTPDVGDKVECLLSARFGDGSRGPAVFGVGTVMDVEPEGGLTIRVPYDYSASHLPGCEGRTYFELVHIHHWDDPANFWSRLYASSWRWPVIAPAS